MAANGAREETEPRPGISGNILNYCDAHSASGVLFGRCLQIRKLSQFIAHLDVQTVKKLFATVTRSY